MPIPWVAILSNIPWSKVIDNAPKLLDGTQKLFNRMKKEPPPPDIEPVVFTEGDETTRQRQLETIIQENRHELKTMHQDLQDAAALLHHLTEQNAKMIGEVEKLRHRTARLQRVVVVITLVVVGLLVYSCTRA